VGPPKSSNPPPALLAAAPAKGGCDVLIAGAGIIGLSIALELHLRGASVTVLDSGRALQQASSAAAGMLAVNDPHNPPKLLPLSKLSASFYPTFLHHIESLSSLSVPIQTETTIQYLSGGRVTPLREDSLDPRQLAAALLAAVRATRIDLREDTSLRYMEVWPSGVAAHTSSGERVSTNHLVYATGAWTDIPRLARLGLPITPRKGQMLRVALPPTLRGLHEVHRSEHVYIVPRTQGPQAGSALIGATVEDAGFDITTHPAALAQLRARAAELLPALADAASAPQLEAWAGLRPATPDHLPLLGRIDDSAEFIATGHFRNGMLLAPATAVVIADLILGKDPLLDVSPFSPFRTSASLR
jgi:glycine oxidase